MKATDTQIEWAAKRVVELVERITFSNGSLRPREAREGMYTTAEVVELCVQARLLATGEVEP